MKLEGENCIKRIEIWEKKEKVKNGGTLISSMWGASSEKKGYIHENIDEYGNFSDKPTKIPPGYKKRKRTKKHYGNEWAKEYFCKKEKSKKQIEKLDKKLKDSLDYYSWYDKTRKYWITFKDIEKLKKNEKIDLLSLDRNVLDVAYDINKPNVSYKAKRFFRDNKITYIHDKEIFGKIKISDKIGAPTIYDSVFNVEYKKDFWYPMYNGYLPAKDKQKIFKLLGKRTHWSKFPKKTHVGFRGPLIRWSDVDKLPKIHYKDD